MRLKLALLGLVVVVLVVLPIALSEFRTAQLATLGAYFIAILGLDVLAGASGQISLGQGAFIGIGAYTTAILMANHGVRDLWTIPLAAAVAGAVGLVVGLPALRLPGLYLALVTFGLAIALPSMLRRFDHFTGGSDGITLAGRSTVSGHGTGVLGLTNGEWLYALTCALALVSFLFAGMLLRSRFGSWLRAVRDSELAAASAGVNVVAVKVAASGISAAFAGVAGALLALDLGRVTPGTFTLQLSLYVVAGAVAGSFASIRGALLGAFLVLYLPDLVGALPHVNGKQAGPPGFFLGLLLVVLMLVLPLVRRVRANAL